MINQIKSVQKVMSDKRVTKTMLQDIGIQTPFMINLRHSIAHMLRINGRSDHFISRFTGLHLKEVKKLFTKTDEPARTDFSNKVVDFTR